MKTSYFGRMNSKAFKEHAENGVCIAKSAKYWSGRRCPKLYPTWEMIKMENEKEYEKAYRAQVLNKLDPLEIYEELEDAILLCHEKAEDIESGKTFCHRRMVAKWLEEELWLQYGMDVTVDELKDDKSDLKKILKGSKQQMELW